MKHILYPSIGQFRNMYQDILRQVTFVGLDENGDPIYDNTIPKPKLTFKGTVKLHGTNAGVSFNQIDGIWAQSRENIITPLKDNAGFAFFVESNKEVFLKLLDDITNKYDIDTNIYSISLYGEWAGGNIQKGVAISNLEKSFFIFGIKISNIEDKSFISYWLDSSGFRSPDNKIYNIEDYKTFSIDINFNMPELTQNQLIDMTLEVEKQCPVSKEFGFDGIGEGIVFSTTYKDQVYRFKSKGDKHSSSHVKILNSVDVDKLNSIQEFVDYTVTENRFKQALENVYYEDQVIIQKIGEVIKWIMGDIIKEESDTLFKNNLEPKDIGKYVANKVRTLFFNYLNK